MKIFLALKKLLHYLRVSIITYCLLQVKRRLFSEFQSNLQEIQQSGGNAKVI